MSAEYRLTGRAESGEFAEIYKALQGREPVVIKLFHPRTSDAAYARELAETARVLNSLGEPGIVEVLELGLVRKRLAVVRREVGGCNLGQALQRLNTKEVLLQPALALSMIVELLELTQRAHEAGVVHGAITPGNVLLGEEGKVAICDFGALRALNAAPSLKKIFGARGRGSYRGPEVAQGDPPAPSADVYSLGAIAYELLTLREPSTGRGAAVSTRHEALPPPSRLDRRVNARLDPIIMRALDPNPARRFRSCGEFAGAIRSFVTTHGGLPSRDEAKRFAAELFPNEVSLEALGPVPFNDAFELSEVRGADLVESDRSQVVSSRPSFSGGEVPAVSGRDDSVETAPGPDEPSFDGTSPGEGGPQEQSWHAPLGAAPQKRPAGPAPGTQPGARLKRVRVIEDFEALPAPPSAESFPLPPPPGGHQAPAPTEVDLPAKAPEPIDANPSTSGFPLVVSQSGHARRMITEERSIYQVAKNRRRLLKLAAGIALLGAASLALLLVSVRSKPSPRPTPPRAAATSPRPVPLAPAKAPDPNERAARPTARDEPAEWHVPPKKGGGFLTVTTDVPAAVFIDGQKVKRSTPLKKYPVAAGSPKIALVNAATGERRELTLRVAKGQLVKVEERFGSAPGRR